MALKWFLCIVAFLPLLAALPARAAEVHGRSSTQLLWFNNFFNQRKQAEFAQYLNLSVLNVDREGKLSFQGYGRVTQDVRNSEGLNGRLYYLYGDYRGLYDKVDIRLGRQWINYAAGTALIDGGQIELRKVGPVGFSIMGGRNVFFDLYGEGTRKEDFVFGTAAYLTGFKNTDAEVSYFLKLDKSGMARNQVGGVFKQYLFNAVKVYANTRYDIVSETFMEVLAGVKVFPTSKLVLTGEWYQSYPIFDATSIYSVFAVDRYQEGVFRVDYTVNDMISIHGGYNRQDYGEGGFGNDGTADVVEVGLGLRPLSNLMLNLTYNHRNGYGGKLDGGIAEVTYNPIKALELAAGLHFDVYERDRSTGEETARRYWGGAKYKFTDKMSASVRVEDNVNVRFSNDWQGRAVFNYDF